MLGLLVLDALSSISLAFWPHRNKHPLQAGARQWVRESFSTYLREEWHSVCGVVGSSAFLLHCQQSLWVCSEVPEPAGPEQYQARGSSHHLLSFSRDTTFWSAAFKGCKHWIKVNKRLKWSWFSMSLLSPCRVVALPSWKTSFKSIWKLLGQWASALLVFR